MKPTNHSTNKVDFSFKTISLAVIQILISAIILFALFKLLDPTEIKRLFRNADIFWLLIAFGILIAQQFLTAERWRLVASILLAPPHGFSFYMFWQGIGSLCSMVLPSILGADLVRTYALSRRTELRIVIRVILVDRALGLLALSVLVLCAFLLAPSFYIKNPLMLMPILIALTGILIYFALTRWALRSRSTNPIISFSQQLGSDLKSTVEATGRAWCILISLLIHVMIVCAFIALGKALNLNNVALLNYFAIVPAALLITIIPLSIGGWGLREGALIFGFGLVGVSAEEGFTLSVMFGVLTTASALVSSCFGLRALFEKQTKQLADSIHEEKGKI